MLGAPGGSAAFAEATDATSPTSDRIPIAIAPLASAGGSFGLRFAASDGTRALLSIERAGCAPLILPLPAPSLGAIEVTGFAPPCEGAARDLDVRLVLSVPGEAGLRITDPLPLFETPSSVATAPETEEAALATTGTGSGTAAPGAPSGGGGAKSSDSDPPEGAASQLGKPPSPTPPKSTHLSASASFPVPLGNWFVRLIFSNLVTATHDQPSPVQGSGH